MPFPEDAPKEPQERAFDGPSQFDPYDPPSVDEGIVPDLPTQPDPEPEPEQQPEPSAPLPEFDERHKQEFTGLMFLGRLQETFTLWGHVFVVRTLSTDALAQVGLIVARYEQTRMRDAVYQTAVVAASVVSVDGKPLPSSIGPDASSDLESVKFPYVMANWMPSVREEVYNRVFALEVKAREVLASMGKASG